MRFLFGLIGRSCSRGVRFALGFRGGGLEGFGGAFVRLALFVISCCYDGGWVS